MRTKQTAWTRFHSIDPDYKEYRVKLTRGWVKATDKLAEESHDLSRFFFDLGHDLRAIEVTACMPSTLVGSFDKFQSGYIKGGAETPTQAVARAIATRLVGRLDIRDAELRTNLLAECLQISQEQQQLKEVPGYSSREVWEEYREDKGFQLALSTSQSQAIAATYHTYENFVVRCVRHALGMPSYRKKSDEKFVQYFTDAFGSELSEYCFNHTNVETLRLFRHAIAHNGGRLTPDLAKKDHGVRLAGEYLQFMPQHLAVSYRIVESRVTRIVKAAATHRAFVRNRK